MKIIDSQGKEYLHNIVFEEVDANDFPFIEIIQQKDLSKCKLDDLSFERIFQLKVNVKKAGSVIFLFDKEELNKEELIQGISPLGELPSVTTEDLINKVKSLYELASKFNPKLSIYYPYGEITLMADCFVEQTNNVPTLYVNNFEEDMLDSKNKKYKKEDTNESRDEKEPKEKKKFKFSNPFKILANDKYHYVFALVAAFLVGFTLDIAIFDMYLGKLIYIFFLICCLIGMVLNCFIYKDTFVSNGFKSMEFIVDVTVSLIGLGLSVGGYFIFLSLAKEIPNPKPSVLLIIGPTLGALILSIAVAFLIKLLINKKRA